MNIFPTFTEDVPLLLTEATLDRYATFLASTSGESDAANGAEKTAAPLESNADYPASSAEEALAPLELLYGKTFVHALAIALHGAEAVTCYIERDSAISSQPAEQQASPPGEGEEAMPRRTRDTSSTTALPHSLRRLYRVGEHVLVSPYYCPCSAYTYKSIRRQEVWCCKHLLALQILLKLESVGIHQANIITREVDSASFCELARESFQKAT
ncbi:hypothetical protein STCU_04033 [Strigomonas culicis]|uniref:SWIM-type domain-containing protein n=1 Tax=Strigomonas culicis TaxID=28005 RepID=S9UP15_9TRYP|nr:hypothetical protein STCU_04167 [Strigomonas culicis]EPY30504.1 hypothetical protein STCU_04033 [Strigomonas culicis]|eukprot:EPY30237.1 hypothetical protein STCU_04167 [Strigomonas culicis]